MKVNSFNLELKDDLKNSKEGFLSELFRKNSPDFMDFPPDHSPFKNSEFPQRKEEIFKAHFNETFNLARSNKDYDQSTLSEEDMLNVYKLKSENNTGSFYNHTTHTDSNNRCETFSNDLNMDTNSKQTSSPSQKNGIHNANKLELAHLRILDHLNKSITKSCNENNYDDKFYKQILIIISRIDKESQDGQVKYLCNIFNKKVLEILILKCTYSTDDLK